MAVKLTPPYGATGYWELKAPFHAKVGMVYSCKEIRSFSMLRLQGVNVYEKYYLPHNLENSKQEEDSRAYASIVTLLAANGERIYVPDTYIEKYPELNTDGYNRYILSCDLGTLPTNTTINHLVEKVSAEVEKALGRKPLVAIHVAPIKSDKLTPAERTREEANRLAQVKDKTTQYGALQRALEDIGNMQAYIKVLEEQIKAGQTSLTDNSKVLERQLEAKVKELKKLQDKFDKLAFDKEEAIKQNATYLERIKLLEKKIIDNGLTIPD